MISRHDIVTYYQKAVNQSGWDCGFRGISSPEFRKQRGVNPRKSGWGRDQGPAKLNINQRPAERASYNRMLQSRFLSVSFVSISFFSIFLSSVSRICNYILRKLTNSNYTTLMIADSATPQTHSTCNKKRSKPKKLFAV